MIRFLQNYAFFLAKVVGCALVTIKACDVGDRRENFMLVTDMPGDVGGKGICFGHYKASR